MELPETITIGRQAAETLSGRMITEVLPPTYRHKFTFFNADAEAYRRLLAGRRILTAEGHGIFVDLQLEDDVFLSVFDGIHMKFGGLQTEIPAKYQMLLTLDDQTFVGFTTGMYGGIYVFRHLLDNKYRTQSLERVSPLEAAFGEAYFERLIAEEKKNISVKALLASEQRIPGLGNGVLQDILFGAEISPKRKIFSLTDAEKAVLFRSVKETLQAMTDGGGRDTETDFFGRRGGYRCLLSKNTFGLPCPRCGGEIRKESYMGGTVYYCPECQRM